MNHHERLRLDREENDSLKHVHFFACFCLKRVFFSKVAVLQQGAVDFPLRLLERFVAWESQKVDLGGWRGENR